VLTTYTLADADAQPQLMSFDYRSDLWILGIFLVVCIVLYKTAWKNVLIGLKAREDRIRKDIADAEAARIKADELLRQYNAKLADAQQQVQAVLAQATADAEKIATSLKMRAQQEAEEAKERATAEIEQAKRNALAEIYDQTANLATAVAEKIIRRQLNPNDQRDLVNESLSQLQSISKN
jgi:F-type H+-transporting ATPase subunit b